MQNKSLYIVIDDRYYTILLVGCYVLAALSQAALWVGGLYSVSADESARAIMAAGVTPKTALDPFIWLPFYKVAVGLALRVYDDLFITPRAFAFFMGLATLASLTYLAKRLFDDRALILLTTALGVFVSHRLVFGAVPQSEMFYNFFVVMGFAFLSGWLRQHKTRDLFVASAFFALASLIRYEAWLISAFFGVALFYMSLFQKRLSFLDLATSGVIVSSTPLLILGYTWLQQGSLSSLFVTSSQGDMFGLTYARMLLHSHAYAFAHDLLTSPLFLSLVPLSTLAYIDKSTRQWIVFFSGTLLVVTLATIATGSTTHAAPWRLGGVWTLLLIPFLAMALLDFVNFYTNKHTRERLKPALLSLATILCMVSFGLGTLDIVKIHRKIPTDIEFQLGRHLRDILKKTTGNILLAADSYSFLNIIVLANRPERIVLNSNSDPLQAGLYVGYEDYWREKDPFIYEKYLAPKFSLAQGGDAAMLREHHISHIVTSNPVHLRALIESGIASVTSQHGSWYILAVSR